MRIGPKTDLQRGLEPGGLDLLTQPDSPCTTPASGFLQEKTGEATSNRPPCVVAVSLENKTKKKNPKIPKRIQKNPNKSKNKESKRPKDPKTTRLRTPRGTSSWDVSKKIPRPSRGRAGAWGSGGASPLLFLLFLSGRGKGKRKGFQ